MAEDSLSDRAGGYSSDRRPTVPVAELASEIDKIPTEYLPSLLGMIRLFRESVTLKPVPSDTWKKLMHDIKNPSPMQTATRQQALSELLRVWREEEDEQEQKETWELLSQALGDTKSGLTTPFILK